MLRRYDPPMSDAIAFVEFLHELGGSDLELHRCDGTLDMAVMALRDGRKLLAIERTYRDGTKVIFDPTVEELEVARNGDLWKLWNSDRTKYIDSLMGPRNTGSLFDGPVGDD